LEEVIGEGDRSGRELSSNPRAVKTVAKLSPDIREAIEERLARRRQEIIEDLKDETLMPRQQRAQIEAAKADICRALEFLSEFSGGTLPHEFCDISKEMGCGLC
jgi:hypothetical protein